MSPINMYLQESFKTGFIKVQELLFEQLSNQTDEKALNLWISNIWNLSAS